MILTVSSIQDFTEPNIDNMLVFICDVLYLIKTSVKQRYLHKDSSQSWRLNNVFFNSSMYAIVWDSYSG